jgi:hypothetical protein
MQVHGLNDSANGTFNSWSLTLMVRGWVTVWKHPQVVVQSRPSKRATHAFAVQLAAQGLTEDNRK